eukprot:TRINITY_DN1838_c0_g1_i1.p1 TRINITY_DN1838_c0_g1~~TRINITY_DN1838_c0_g1_i1.p1  ORF type:complete len:294 (+),score=114.84 TRINITY_DN1838_c0_g1_i1:55-936(+)
MNRNLTSKFNEEREKSKNKVNSTNNGNVEIELANLNQGSQNANLGWMATVDEIQYNLNKVSTRMQSLEQLYNQSLLPDFVEESTEDHQIDIQTKEITRLLQSCQNKIKKMGNETKVTEQADKIRKNVQASLAAKIQEMCNTFREKQRNYLLKKQKMESKFSADEIDQAMASSAKSDINFLQMNERQITIVSTEEHLARQQAEETRQILRSVNELADIFNDMAVLVVEQGTLLDRIEYNIEQTAVETKEAVVELRQAEESAKNATTKYCILILGILIGIMILVVIFKAAFSSLI